MNNRLRLAYITFLIGLAFLFTGYILGGFVDFVYWGII